MNTRLYIKAACAIITMAACSKTEFKGNNAYGDLSFYNAAYTLHDFLPVTGGNNKKVTLRITPEGNQPTPLIGRGTPYFAATADSRQDFPAIVARYDLPWTEFDHYSPGNYTAEVQLHSPGTVTTSRFSFPFTVKQDSQQTYILSDSLGVFHSTVIAHTRPKAGHVRLQLIQLCPDADSVNMRIGNYLLPGMQNLPYRSTAGYMDYPLTADSTLKLRLFNAGDTTNVMARIDLPAKPGESFMLVCWKYRQEHQYTDKNGNMIHVVPGALLDARKIE